MNIKNEQNTKATKSKSYEKPTVNSIGRQRNVAPEKAKPGFKVVVHENLESVKVPLKHQAVQTDDDNNELETQPANCRNCEMTLQNSKNYDESVLQKVVKEDSKFSLKSVSIKTPSEADTERGANFEIKTFHGHHTNETDKNLVNSEKRFLKGQCKFVKDPKDPLDIPASKSSNEIYVKT